MAQQVNALNPSIERYPSESYNAIKTVLFKSRTQFNTVFENTPVLAQFDPSNNYQQLECDGGKIRIWSKASNQIRIWCHPEEFRASIYNHIINHHQNQIAHN